MASVEHTAVDEFKDELQRYGFESKFESLTQAIRSSLLTDGRPLIEMDNQDASVLQQLGVGWSKLTDKGRRVGLELIDIDLSAHTETIQQVLEFAPPRVVALFLRAAGREQGVCTLRFHQESGDFDKLYYIQSLVQLIEHQKLHTEVMALGKQLERYKLAVMRVALPYATSKWTAQFIHFPATLAEIIEKFVVDRDIDLKEADQSLKEYSLLNQTPALSLDEFDLAGLPKETLERHLGNAVERNIVTPVVDQGPAFLILKQSSYKQAVLRPLFDRLVDGMVSQNRTPGHSCNKSGKKPGRTSEGKGKNLSADLVLGSEGLSEQWGVLGKAGTRRVQMDLNAPHVAFMCGKMGSGKGYTIGVLCEMLAGKTITDLTCIPHPATVIVLYKPREDLPSEFYSITQANDVLAEVETLRNEYQSEPEIMVEPNKLRVFIDPFVHKNNRGHFEQQYGIQNVKPLYVDPSSLRGEDWSTVLGIGANTDQLYIRRLFRILERLQYEPFDLNRVLKEVDSDGEMTANQKNLARQRIDNLKNYLAGTPSEDFVRNLAIGGVNIIDFRETIRTTDDVFSIMTLVISALQSKNDLDEEPFVFVINEAHDYFNRGVSDAFVGSIEHLIRRKRQGNNWLLLDTHFPDDIDDKVVQLADLKFVHFLDTMTNSAVLNRAFGQHTSEFSRLKIGEAFVAADNSSDGQSQVFRVSVRPRLTKHGAETKTAV